MTEQLIAKASGTRIYKVNESISIRKEPLPSLNIAIFVFALLTFIPTINGIIFSLNKDLNSVGMIILFFGIIMGSALFVLVKKRIQINHLPYHSLKIICEFNPETSYIVDHENRKIGKLNEFRLKKSMQLSSSSKKLLLTSGDKSVLIAKGNPFAGGIEPLHRALSNYFN